jgi:large subunit ribosomal protein L15
MRDFIKKLPKLRGHGKNRARTVNGERETAVVVNLAKLEVNFNAGEVVTPKTLVAKGVVSAVSKKAPMIKILATGEITKKLTIQGCQISKAAQEKIEKAGGTVSK